MVDDLFFLPLGELICTFYVSINLISLRELQLLLYIATVVFLVAPSNLFGCLRGGPI